MTRDRLYIATRDPRDGGGVASMAEFVYTVADNAGYDPCLVFNMLDRESQVRLSAPWKYVTAEHDEYHQMKVNGMESRGIPLIFPEIEFTQYVANLQVWEDAVGDGDLFFAVGGTNHSGVPFLNSHPFGNWTATLLWDDRKDRLASASLVERLRDRLSKPILEYLERRVFEAAEPMYLLSRHTADRLSEKYDFEHEDLSVIPFPIDTNKFTPDGEAVSKEGPTLLFVGRINDPRKNISALLRAFSAVRRDYPNATLRLIGAEPDAKFREVAEVNEVKDAVEFVGPVPNDELPVHYRGADLFVIPSNQEGLAIVGLEAMACGTPVLSTRCGGPEEYVREGKTGRLVSKYDEEKLGDALVELLADPESLTEMGERARKLVEREYAESVVRDRFVEAFDRLASSR